MVAKKENNQQEIQELYMQLQYINGQLQEMEKEAEAVDQKKHEFMLLAEKLNQFDKIKNNSASFADIGVGIFAKTKIADTKELLVNVGANTFVSKSVKEVKDTLKNQVKEFDKVIQQLSQNMQIMAIQSQMIQAELQKDLGM